MPYICQNCNVISIYVDQQIRLTEGSFKGEYVTVRIPFCPECGCYTNTSEMKRRIEEQVIRFMDEKLHHKNQQTSGAIQPLQE